MTVQVSSHVLEAMGFRDLIAKGELSGSFMSVTVYEARGITLPEGFASGRQARVAGTSYRVALSKTINAGCKSLIGDDYADSEEEVQKELKSTGPFVLIAVGPTEFVECDAGRMMRTPDGSITTFDSFSAVRGVLKGLEDRVLPQVVSTLTLALNEADRYVTLRKLGRASAARTPDGTTLHDMRIEMHAEGWVARSLLEGPAIQVLDELVARAPTLNPRAARYFALGTAEKDELKKFLFFFLSLEVETHAIFGKTDHAGKVQAQVGGSGTVAPRRSTLDLIARDIAEWDNLFDRFVWCANCSWPKVDEEDIKLFKELKKARDAIAHGRSTEPPTGFARKAEVLAHKVLWS
jgi:hypothetical protein